MRSGAGDEVYRVFGHVYVAQFAEPHGFVSCQHLSYLAVMFLGYTELYVSRRCGCFVLVHVRFAQIGEMFVD